MAKDYSTTLCNRVLVETGLTAREQRRFWRSILPPNEEGCSLWNRHKDKKGYGIFQLYRFGKWIRFRAHRVAYYLRHSTIDPNLTIDHTCRERGCQTDEHHVEKTRGANVLATPFSMSSINLAKEFCDYGHPLSPDNVRVYTSKKGKEKRVCLLCARSYARNYMRRYNNIPQDKERGVYRTKPPKKTING